MTRRSRICLALLALAVLVVASCDSGSDNSGASKRGHSIEGMLGEIPASAFDDSGRLQIVTGDLDLATEAAGLKRPAADTDPGSTGLLDDWLLPLKGADRGFEEKMATLLPDVANHDFVDNGAIADELGWSLVDVHSFIELQNVPEVFTVLAADVTAKDLTDAIGPPDHDIWSLGGDDSAINVDETSAARPLGGSVRMALHDGLLAMSRSTP
ncbi:MAG: hypothetical protein ABI862_04815, partial [Ilumatobacteraceae bacterium]